MDSVLSISASFPKASFIAAGGSCLRSKKRVKNFHAGSYVTKSLWHKTGKTQKEYCAISSLRHNLKHHYKGIIEGGSTREECERKYVVNGTSELSSEYEPQAQDRKSIWDSVKDALYVFYRFTRPYTVYGTALGTTSASLLAVEKLSDLSPTFFVNWLQALVAAICMQIFNSGLNQLCDVELDKINKPYLPLPSGECSFRTGVIIVASSLILGCWLAWITGSWPLIWTVFIGYMYAAAYSIDLPLLRWKKYAMLAMMSISTFQAVIIPLGYFLHMQNYVFKRPATFSRPLIFCIAITSAYNVIIPFLKDLPDVEGDKEFGIKSLGVRLGQKRVFWICISILEMAYGVAILAATTSPFIWSKIIIGLGHASLASILWYRAKFVDLKSKDALQSFYMFIFKLYYVEQFLIPLFR